MKEMMRKAAMTLIGAIMACVTVTAGNSRAISREELPGMAQKIIKENFAKRKVAMMKLETGFFEKTTYDVVFTNGDKIEFDDEGNWVEISCRRGAVPGQLVPSDIRSYLREHYPKTRVVEIEKSRNKYEVKLSNGLEITFNENLRVIDIDD